MTLVVAAELDAPAQVDEGERWYTPHPWIGGALSVLLIERLAWRWAEGALSSGMQPALSNASALTLGIAARKAPDGHGMTGGW